MTDLLCAIATVALLCFSMVAQPKRATCPPGWWLDGVSYDGRFGCAFSDDKREWPPIDAYPSEVYGRIHCTGGTRAIRTGTRSVGCQR